MPVRGTSSTVRTDPNAAPRGSSRETLLGRAIKELAAAQRSGDPARIQRALAAKIALQEAERIPPNPAASKRTKWMDGAEAPAPLKLPAEAVGALRRVFSAAKTHRATSLAFVREEAGPPRELNFSFRNATDGAVWVRLNPAPAEIDSTVLKRLTDAMYRLQPSTGLSLPEVVVDKGAVALKAVGSDRPYATHL